MYQTTLHQQRNYSVHHNVSYRHHLPDEQGELDLFNLLNQPGGASTSTLMLDNRSTGLANGYRVTTNKRTSSCGRYGNSQILVWLRQNTIKRDYGGWRTEQISSCESKLTSTVDTSWCCVVVARQTATMSESGHSQPGMYGQGRRRRRRRVDRDTGPPGQNLSGPSRDREYQPRERRVTLTHTLGLLLFAIFYTSFL